MKEFKNFISTIDFEETIKQSIKNNLNKANAEWRIGAVRQSDENYMITHIVLDLLEKYHDWLHCDCHEKAE